MTDAENTIAESLAVLESQGARGVIVDDDSPAWSWFVKHYPARGAHVDWRGLSDVSSASPSGEQSSTSALASQLIDQMRSKVPTDANHGLEPHVLIAWSSNERPLVELSLTEALQALDTLVEEDWETWVVCHEEGWALEHNARGVLTVGRPGAIEQWSVFPPRR